ncbi:tetratricopeptide repeat-containing sensor histidine kinase [Lutibacter citreus]|uniref:tetratricopeptide repeat-containing sensor histidine kinase n=1 Tax=Lutibacter citreus TaxID=2138210 RepID=UPI000DBE064C|nr:histidine kinase dimerization/phosphoacceptor domain -containing protein [Lutibacter citreus]
MKIHKVLICNYKNNILFSVFVALVFIASSFAQNITVADSLVKILKENNLSKEERSRILSKISYNHMDIDSSLFFAKRALAIAKDIDNLSLQAVAWEEISHIERRLGNNSNSLEASLTALHIYDSLSLKERKAASYVQLGSNSISDEDYISAIKYLKNAEHIYTISDKRGNLILTKLNLGEAYRLAGKLDSAAIYFKETLKKNKTLNSDIVQSYSLGNLGMVLSAQGNYEAGKQHLNEAIKILTPLDDFYSTSIYTAELGDIYVKEQNWSLGESKLLKAYNLAINSGLKEQIRDFSRKLTDFYKTRKHYDKALSYLEVNRIYQDSLVNKASIQKVEQLKANYEIGKKETEIKLLNTINTNQKNQLILLIISVFIFSLLAYMLFRSNKAIKKVNKRVSSQNVIIEKREQEKVLLLKELNHRVKNNLQMISSLLNLQSRELSGHPAQEALITGKNRVEALSLVHRKLYQEGSETKVFLKDYIEELVLGLFYSYNITFKPNLNIDNSSISIDKAIPLALIVNELVVNSIKYAYKDIKNPIFKIQVKEVNDKLEIDISDNGIGFTEKEEDKANSFGIKLITSLTEQLDGSIKRLLSHGTHWKIIIKGA